MGGFAGRWLLSAASESRKVLGLAGAGVAALVVGEIWNLWFPINKNLWTSSYAVFTAGFACVLLAFCYSLVEIRKWKRWTGPFLVFGSNSIAAFGLSGLIAKTWIVFKFTADGKQTSTWGYLYQHFFAPIGSPQQSSLLFALAFVLMCWLVLAVLYWRKIFIKISFKCQSGARDPFLQVRLLFPHQRGCGLRRCFLLVEISHLLVPIEMRIR